MTQPTPTPTSTYDAFPNSEKPPIQNWICYCGQTRQRRIIRLVNNCWQVLNIVLVVKIAPGSLLRLQVLVENTVSISYQATQVHLEILVLKVNIAATKAKVLFCTSFPKGILTSCHQAPVYLRAVVVAQVVEDWTMSSNPTGSRAFFSIPFHLTNWCYYEGKAFRSIIAFE